MSRLILGLAAVAALLTAPALAANPNDRSGMSPGTRYDGPYYTLVQVPQGVPAACRDTCRGDLRCYAWNYKEATGDCELLSNVPTLVWDDTHISGEVARSQPAPDPDEVVTPRTPDGSTPPPPPYKPGEKSADEFWGQYDMQLDSEASGAAYATWNYVGKGDGGVTRCATACAGDDKCRAFVVRSDADLAPKPQVMCELKSSPGRLLRNPDAMTGLKH
ncbi:hypothetical protein sos41_17630 [Alphaproteobacteria bacterium SO-S41]|nr:hypothetical protein sos41_17630 [Alphaproteobacteria bacterium SO-S41]